MDVASTTGFKPEPPANIAVTGKVAIVDAMEDIVFGSVCILPSDQMDIYLCLLDRRHSWEVH